MKRFMTVFIGIILTMSLSGCQVQRLSTDKLADLSFTVVEKERIPEEMKAKIAEKEKNLFKITYADNGYLYIAEGYGVRDTSGYSIEVDECYETENAVYIHTNLIGPDKAEKVTEAETCPYVVVKLEFIDKNVVFK